MVSNSKILTVSYGTFSCTLEGFDDSFDTMKAIAEYFRDLAADDRYFGAEPAAPDAEMLARIAEREISRRVEVRDTDGNIHLRAGAAALPVAAPQETAPKETAPTEAAAAPQPVAQEAPSEVTADEWLDHSPPQAAPTPRQNALASESIADKLRRIRAVATPGVSSFPVNGFDDDEQARDLITATAEFEDDDIVADQTPDAVAAEPPSFDDQVATDDAPLDTSEESADDVIAADDAVAEAPIEVPAPDELRTDALASEEPGIDAVSPDSFAEDIAASDVSAEPASEIEESGDDDILSRIGAETAQPTQDTVSEITEERPQDAEDTQEWVDADDDELEAFLRASDVGHPNLDYDYEDEAAPQSSEQNTLSLLLSDAADGEPQDDTAEDDDAAPHSAADEAASQASEQDTPSLLLTNAINGEPQNDTAEDDTAASDSAADEAAPQSSEQDAPSLLLTNAINGEPHHDTAEDDTAASDSAAKGDVVADRPQGARVIKMKRADLDAALADSDLYEEMEEAAGPSDLSPEAETDLQRELAEVEAELEHSRAPNAQIPHPTYAPVPTTDADIEADIKDHADKDTDDDVDREVAAALPKGDDNTQDDGKGIEAEQHEAAPQNDPGRAGRLGAPASDAQAARIFDEANTQLGEPESNKRRSVIQHLRAAVAATRAERRAGVAMQEDVDDQPYRNDLQSAVRPRRPHPVAASATPRPAASMAIRPAPLKLVAEQRIDQPTQPVRPRRITRADVAMTPQSDDDAHAPDAIASNSDHAGFAKFAEQMGANSLTDLLEAAAAYMADIEGTPQFSRPMLMQKLREANDDEFSREDGLRSFGQLLRQGKLQKLKGGRFAVTSVTDFRQSA
ncbi:hypothetical protein [Roseovarius sp. Pro17]|uniref:hypothetical protein n=1 Tax=Roseovarius sp. Pro17 TaxID=3108175 RepID=UPI002D795AB0|nr:hypothetical protein [Roseovarius sp. Pro17]